jgi:hypothetical protein
MDEMLIGLTAVAFHHIPITIFWVSFPTITLTTRVGSFAFAFAQEVSGHIFTCVE